ncbi:hypothetical protein PFICI_11940 [Pestalotiopsis fici W106-1]|uniref:AB hydrolase-1 domain-containing protein n=1 Tax=Pestalotiopsis fici (strain W106-1 / CGMCC3.15140) TaxID=1229662 RepID=W3WRS2_PESFW|nr:uncharacterized protein PFICI_11940 [Pestalotiopsis fici W106-1]ETS76553.1 hypothetical protein PFICI_11940 [Pestalotiopsis fici W106-1]
MTSSHPNGPAIVLVQGSFQLPDVYSKLAEALRDCGYQVFQPPMPSLMMSNKPDFVLKSLETDALAVRSKIIELVDAKRTVFVVMHSYGGLVGTEAVTEDLTAAHRQSQGEEGGVVHLFYFAAFILSKGQSVLNTFGNSPNHDVKPDGRFVLKNAAEVLYHDLPAKEAERWASRLLYQAPKVQEYALTNEAFRFVPSTYLVCEKDRGPPPQYQHMFGTKAGSKILSMQCGHSPMLSHTSELTEMIVQAIKSVDGGSR